MFWAYREAARRYGFKVAPDDPGMFTTFVDLHGQSRGHRMLIHCNVRERTRDTTVFFEPPFDLGLDVFPAGHLRFKIETNLKWIGRLFGRTDLHLGDGELDRALDVHGDEEARVRSLLEPLRAPLLDAVRSGRAFHVTDGGVTLRSSAALFLDDSAEDLVGDVDAASHLAVAFENIRDAVPVASGLTQHARVFSDLAEARRMHSSSTPLAVWGSLRGRSFSARALRIGDNLFELLLGLELAEPLPAPLRVLRRDGATTDFDSTFETRTALPFERLPEQVQRSLLAFDRTGHRVSLDDNGLRLQHPLGPEPYPLDEHVATAEEMLDVLEQACSPRAGYR